MTDLAALDLATTEFRRRLAGVSTDRWDAPTPCDPWTARQLAWHVVGGNRLAAVLLGGGSRGDAIAAIKAAERDPGDPGPAYDDSAAAQLAAFGTDGALDRTVHHPAGDIDGRRLLGFRVADLLLHGWDLARATGGDERLDPGLVELVWAGLSPLAPFIGQTGFFGEGPSGTRSESDELQTRLLDLTGRRP